MKLARFLDPAGHVQQGIDRGDGTAEVLVDGLFAAPPRGSGKVVAIAKRLAPIAPSNIFCIGLNYRRHAEETGAEIPKQPVVFMKPTTAVIAESEAILLPACSRHGPEVDYECELAVVIGTAGKDIAEKDALKHVLGYTVANDVSARRWQKHSGGGQWVRGKSFDTFCPLGPVLVTAGTGGDDIADPQALRLTTRLNGEVMQDDTSGDMIFTVAQLIAFLSQDTTLLPGTVILTGTPPGVGTARKPAVYLKDGDTVEVSIEGIGTLTNSVRDAAARTDFGSL